MKQLQVQREMIKPIMEIIKMKIKITFQKILETTRPSKMKITKGK